MPEGAPCLVQDSTPTLPSPLRGLTVSFDTRTQAFYDVERRWRARRVRPARRPQMPKSKKTSVNRRGFLKGAAAGGAALALKPVAANAQQAQAQRSALPVPSDAALAAE